MDFDEKIFLWSLCARPEDSKRMMNIFRPDWLGDARFQPILSEIYAFTKRYGEPPSIHTLHKVFKEKDNDFYELRMKEPLQEIESERPDTSEILYTLGQAKSVAVVRSFIELRNNPSFVENEVVYDGDTIIKEVHTWLTKFSQTSGDRTMDLKQAIEGLIQTTGFNQVNERIPVGIDPIDLWTGKGLRRKQVGVALAPTGHGKTALLNIIAHKIATIERKRVWFITNELSIEEVTERLMTRLSGIELTKIIDDPIVGFKGLTRHWVDGLHNRLWLSEINREVSTDDIEAEMASWANLRGYKPDVIVLDYMERMKPTLTGYQRDKEWQWLGAIATDLVRLAKRHNILIWSAAQTNREGLSATGGITGSMAQSSIRHLQECTSVIGIHQEEIPGDKDRVAMTFSSIKQRQSKKALRPISLIADLAKMNVTNETVDMQSLKQQENAQRIQEAVEEQKDIEKGASPLQDQKRYKKGAWKK